MNPDSFISDSRHVLFAFDFSSRRRIFLEPTHDLFGDVIPLSHLGAQWGHFLDLLLELLQDLLHGQAIAFRKLTLIRPKTVYENHQNCLI